MKKLARAVLGIAVVFALAGCKKVDEAKFVLGLDASFPPLGFTEADGTIAGYDIDLAKEACARLHYKFEAKPIDWNSKEIELSTGNIDCIWNGFTITEKRSAEMAMTAPYLKNDQVLVVRSDSGIKTLADAKGKVIGLQEGSSAEKAVEGNPEFAKSVSEVRKYVDNLVALTELELGGIDAVVMDSVVAEYEITKGKKPLECISESLAKEGYGIGFRKDEAGEKLRDEIWNTLLQMAEDGTVAKISEKWFGTDISVIAK